MPKVIVLYFYSKENDVLPFIKPLGIENGKQENCAENLKVLLIELFVIWIVLVLLLANVQFAVLFAHSMH